MQECRERRAVLLKIGKENLLVSRTFCLYTSGCIFVVVRSGSNSQIVLFHVYVFVLTICLFCTFGFDIDFLFCFTFFTLNLLFSFSLKYLISVQKFDILPSSLQSSVLVCVRVRLCLCTFDL